MRPNLTALPRFALLLALASGAVSALAQLPPAPPPTGAAPDQVYGRNSQRVEILQTEDKNTRLNEVRQGGEMRRMEVESKAGWGRYNVEPQRVGQPDNDRGNAGRGQWSVFQW